MRQLVLEKQKVKNGLILIEGKDYHYLRQVLRVKVGDMINVRLRDGSLQNSTVTTIDDKSKKIKLQICSYIEDRNEDFEEKSITRGVQASEFNAKLPNTEFWLFQFIPKPVKFEQIVKQATECGISVIIPLIGEYSEKSSIISLEMSKKERLERIIKEARQQSGSPVNTKVLSPMKLDEAIEIWNNESTWYNDFSCQHRQQLGFVLSERDNCKKKLRNIVEENSKIDKLDLKKIGIVVGCEGGISPLEIDVLQKKGMFYPIHFAVNILRCETAALYGIAAIQTAIDEIINNDKKNQSCETKIVDDNEEILTLEEEEWL